MIKLIASDMDGTLLDAHMSISGGKTLKQSALQTKQASNLWLQRVATSKKLVLP